MRDSASESSVLSFTRRDFVKRAGLGGAVVLVAGALAACGTNGSAGSGATAGTESSDGKIQVLAAENEYGDVASQIGGEYVEVTSIISNPDTDPHDFEATPSDAKLMSTAAIAIENGLGYDDWFDEMLSASENADRVVISAQQTLGLSDDTENPHLWYDPKTMPAAAEALVAELAKIDPDHSDDYQQNLSDFKDALESYTSKLSDFKQNHPGAAAAATEPVANYLLDAAGIDIKTPWSLQSAIMNDQDPSAQDANTQMSLLSDKQVDVFVYNQQVSSSLTQKWLDAASAAGVPVVAVYETMPDGFGYVDWMCAEVDSLEVALSQGQSTTSLS
jgi:zinc/manganese transport system substrate-binding protein